MIRLAKIALSCLISTSLYSQSYLIGADRDSIHRTMRDWTPEYNHEESDEGSITYAYVWRDETVTMPAQWEALTFMIHNDTCDTILANFDWMTGYENASYYRDRYKRSKKGLFYSPNEDRAYQVFWNKYDEFISVYVYQPTWRKRLFGWKMISLKKPGYMTTEFYKKWKRGKAELHPVEE